MSLITIRGVYDKYVFVLWAAELQSPNAATTWLCCCWIERTRLLWCWCLFSGGPPAGPRWSGSLSDTNKHQQTDRAKDKHHNPHRVLNHRWLWARTLRPPLRLSLQAGGAVLLVEDDQYQHIFIILDHYYIWERGSWNISDQESPSVLTLIRGSSLMKTWS